MTLESHEHTRYTLYICICNTSWTLSMHMPFIQRRINVDATSGWCINVTALLTQRCTSAGVSSAYSVAGKTLEVLNGVLEIEAIIFDLSILLPVGRHYSV